jgi:hypothetical protein
MSTRSRDLRVRSPIVELSRVVVLGGSPVEGSRLVNKLMNDRTLLLKKYTWMARAVVTEQSPGPGGRLWLSGVRASSRLQHYIHK